ncbi:MAG: hypothetical protein A2W31_15215 [Planctomycetes bacterium RBG_16_64_10]|nr:MAG: hypothetical protein A2W31_15215 [Planctomycetes bacterium RBG_16_64_10]
MSDESERLTNDEFASRLMEMAKTAGPFKPYAWLDPDGGQLDVYWSDESYYTRPIVVDRKEVMALHIGQDTGQIVGVTVFGVRRMAKKITSEGTNQ